jgi:hypothetical protein
MPDDPPLISIGRLATELGKHRDTILDHRAKLGVGSRRDDRDAWRLTPEEADALRTSIANAGHGWTKGKPRGIGLPRTDAQNAALALARTIKAQRAAKLAEKRRKARERYWRRKAALAASLDAQQTQPTGDEA